MTCVDSSNGEGGRGEQRGAAPVGLVPSVSHLTSPSATIFFYYCCINCLSFIITRLASLDIYIHMYVCMCVLLVLL